MTNEIINVVVKAVFAILGVIITYKVIPWIKSLMEKWWAKIAVDAAEKLYQQSGMGEKKYDYAISFLESIGLIKLDKDGKVPVIWKSLIEACVKELDIQENKIKEVVDSTTEK